MRYSPIKMATNGLTFASSCALRFTMNFVIFGMVTNVFAGSHDHANSKESHKNLEFPKHRRNTEWLMDFDFTQPKKSTKSSNQGKSETREMPEDPATKKSEWQKQMEEISLREREKWKNYPTEKPESLTFMETENTSIKNFGNETKISPATRREFGIDKLKEENAKSLSKTDKITGSKITDKEIFHQFKEDRKLPEKDNDNDQDFPRTISTAVHKRYEPESSVENKSVEKFDRISNGMKFFETKKQLSKNQDEKLQGLRKRLAAGIENGRWGMSGGGSKPPSETNEKTIDKNDKSTSERLTKKVGDHLENPREDIWQGRWGMSEIKPPEKFLEDITSPKKNTGGIKRPENHSSRLKSVDKKSDEIKNAIPGSNDEYWMSTSDESGEKRISEITRRTLNTEDLPKSVKNAEAFRKLNPHSATAVPKLIQIVISPYFTAAYNTSPRVKNGVELSIDRLIHEKNGMQRPSALMLMEMEMEIQPIVIRLSTKVCDQSE